MMRAPDRGIIAAERSLPGTARVGWFTYFRLYGPKRAYFDGSWQLGDLEEVN